MKLSSQHINQRWVWFFTVFIFFFNAFLLPEGMTYTLLLTPVWAWLLYRQKKLSTAILACLPLAGYAIIQSLQGVNLYYYLVSSAMIISLIIFLTLGYEVVNHPGIKWDPIFRDIALLNFLFVLLSLPLLFLPSLRHIAWYLVPISPNIPVIPRLKLFTLEASHYSFWLVPVLTYFYSKVLFLKSGKSVVLAFILTIPLLLSFSIGVIGGLLISFIPVLILYFRNIFPVSGQRVLFFISLGALPLLILLAYHFYPDNALFARIRNIFKGDDTSARGRTYEAFILAHKIAAQKSLLWGVGPGQLKLIGRETVIRFYGFTNPPAVVRLPNASAETLAYFGYTGLIGRLLMELLLFFKTRVIANPYRLWLFAFIFIYQFTGSYITNAAEYIVWLFAFSSAFPQFDKEVRKNVLLYENQQYKKAYANSLLP